MSTSTTPDPTDHQLLRRHVAGDDTAFAELVRRHRDRLWAVALRTLGDPEEAADALQDALLAAFRRAESFRGDAKVTTWLHRIVVNACLDRARRRRVRLVEPLAEEDDRQLTLSVPEGPDSAEVQERRADILAALRQISPDQRAAIVLVDMEGLSMEEAAQTLECAVGTVKSRCSRGRAKLLPLLAHLRDAPVGESARPGNHSGDSRVRTALPAPNPGHAQTMGPAVPEGGTPS